MDIKDATKKDLEIYKKEDILKSSTEYFDGDVMAAEVWMNKYALKDAEGNVYELNPDHMHRRIAKEIARIESNYKNPLTEDEIFDTIKDFKYIVPQGGPMSGIGNKLQVVSLSNCFVIGDGSDSYGSILKIDQEQVQLMKRRGGVGHDLSHIRPKGSPVKNSALTSTGIVPFMERYSNTTREVAQDGRRGALMLSVSVKHPDAESFIDAKMTEGKITGANISVKLTDDFMKAVLNDEVYIQQFPIGSEEPSVVKEKNAKEIWDKIIHNAWKSAEPGILFWDNLINESIPDCYAEEGFKTVSTNPCGEIPLCPDDSCRLLAINLYEYVKNPFTSEAKFDFDLFKQHIRIAQRMMDDIVELEIEKIDAIIEKVDMDPESTGTKRVELELWQRIRVKAEQGRRTGLGITAEGDMLAALGLTYGTQKATSFSEGVHKTLKLEAYRSSVEMAKQRGPFEIWDMAKEKGNPFIERIKKEDESLYKEMMTFGRRNIALLTIAPTGTTSLMTRTTSGIEPVFKPVYMRRRKINPQEKDVKVDFVDKQGESWQEYVVFHHKFETYLNVKGYDIDEVKNMNKEELQVIVDKSPYYKATSDDVDWVEKVKMQGAIQKHIDHSISVTVNLPNDATEEIVSKVYEAGWKSGCKGITVYRDGSREGVLVSTDDKKEQIEVMLEENHAIKRPVSVDADVIFFQNNYEKWIAFVGKVPVNGVDKPYELFTGKHESFFLPPYVEKGRIVKRKTDKGSIYDFVYLDKDGIEIVMKKLSRSFNKEYWNYAKLISGILRQRMPMQYVVALVESLDLDDSSLTTWKKGVIRVFKKFIKDGTKTKGECPNCGANLVLIEGCEKCIACGKYSRCG